MLLGDSTGNRCFDDTEVERRTHRTSGQADLLNILVRSLGAVHGKGASDKAYCHLASLPFSLVIRLRRQSDLRWVRGSTGHQTYTHGFGSLTTGTVIDSGLNPHHFPGRYAMDHKPILL